MKLNSINYSHVLRLMKEMNYQGYFAIEYVWMDWENCDDVDTVSETVLMRDLANKYR